MAASTYITKLIFIVLLISITLGGCERYNTKKRINNIETSITNYSVAMRWASYLDAYNYHVSPDGSQPPADLNALEKLSVTGINIIEKIINETQTEMLVKMEIDYYFKEQGTLKTLRLEQRWWRNEANERWFIDSEFPQFK